MPARLAAFTLILTTMALTLATGTDAGELLYALKASVLAHDVPDLWSGFQVEQDAADISLEAQFSAAWALPLGVIRPVIGGTINIRGDTSHAYIDARWRTECPSRMFFEVGLGAAIHDGETGGSGAVPDKKWLGSRVQFHIPVEVGIPTSTTTTTCRSTSSTHPTHTRRNTTKAWTVSVSVTVTGSRAAGSPYSLC